MFSCIRVLLGTLLCITLSTPVWADATAADHAPIGVMGDHRHKKGEWMTSYRYMYMDMGTNYRGGERLETSDVHDEFMVAPTFMEMHMHMVGVMYGVTDDVTMMLMVPYGRKSMDHQLRNGVRFTTNSEGVGDVKLSGLIRLWEEENHTVHLNFGLSFPTGSIKQKDWTPASADGVLPYPMQIGSGTYDLLPGVTYFGHSGKVSWGAQFKSTNRLGENDRDYTLGDRYHVTSWLAYEPVTWLSGSIRLEKSIWGKIDGRDADLNANMVQTANTTRSSGKRLDMLFGINLIGIGDHLFHDHRLALEWGFPLDIQVDGPQLANDWTFMAGWQKAF